MLAGNREFQLETMQTSYAARGDAPSPELAYPADS